ncbi:UDP-glucose dehydrogenase family protein [Natronospora cellulosivora (SeqCode)]
MYKNKISIIGTGYVGLVGGVCLADFGNTIINVDINQEKIDKLNNGQVPIYEPGLEEVLKRNVEAGRISFTTDIEAAVKESEVIFISVGTPPADDGSADLSFVLSVAKSIGQHMNSYKVIVDKSTVPIGTGRKVRETINAELKKRGENFSFDVVSNPEFLREGKAVYDVTHPDRVVVGTENEKARDILKEVYRALYLNDVPFVFTNLETAEMIKYASNAFLATKISFINEMSILCEKVGADVQKVAKAMGMDGRISNKFLHAGPGYGGSCFPKDTKAITSIADENGVELKVIKAAIEANERQKHYMVEKIEDVLAELKGKKIGVLGLSFKPETDDMREAPALTIIPELIKKGASIAAFDPEGMEEARWRLKDYEKDIVYCANEYEVMKGADALVIVTEWNQFRRLDLSRVKDLLAGNVFFDLRNVYEKEEVEEKGLYYVGVGKAQSKVLEEISKAKEDIAASNG